MKVEKCAEKHSANCFLNSLFREWNDFYHDRDSSSFIVHLNSEDSLIIPLTYFSVTGRHEYADIFFIKDHKSEELCEISFSGTVRILLRHLSECYQTSPDQIKTFISRIDNSLENISTALNARAEEITDLYNQSEMDFIEAEQALLIGHTFHPHPKSRDEFSPADYQTYAPETGGEFFMHWFMVQPQVLHQHISKNFSEKKWAEKLFLDECGSTSEYLQYINDGFIPFPVHPWQREVILKNESVKKYLSQGLIIDTGKTFHEEKWQPTTSLRSVYRKSSPYMLKFSLSVRLTNSVRHLLPLEVVRGLQVMDVFSTKPGQEFLGKFPQFNVIFEPAFAALLDENKNIINESIVANRLNPFQKNSSQKIVLATLTQDHPVIGKSLIGSMIDKVSEQAQMSQVEAGKIWFGKFLTIAVKPLLFAQANYGIYLGAHQQNLILEIKDSQPFASYFRDCQGTGYSKTGFEIFSSEVDLMTKENGNILDESMGNTLFSYYLIINSTFNVISAIARDAGIPESALMEMLRENLLQWKNEGVRDSSCIDYLLNEKHLLQKGNFLCSFINMNENTTANPLDIYNKIPNPICEK